MKEKVKTFLFLHILLFIYSMGGICSKLAAAEKFLSFKFILLYGILVTIIWGLIWGLILFHEKISIFNILGIVIIIFGVYLVVAGEEKV